MQYARLDCQMLEDYIYAQEVHITTNFPKQVKDKNLIQKIEHPKEGKRESWLCIFVFNKFIIYYQKTLCHGFSFVLLNRLKLEFKSNAKAFL